MAVEFPKSAASISTDQRYVIADVSGANTVTARPITGRIPHIRSATPCVVSYMRGAQQVSIDAVVVSSTNAAVMLRLDTAEQRRSPRYRRPIGVAINVRGSDLGVIEGVTEDISLGGVRVNVNVALPLEGRILLSIRIADAPPIQAAGQVLSCSSTGAGGSYVARIAYTMMSAEDQTRLAALIDWLALG